MTMINQLTEHDRIELLARAQDAWDRAPQNTMRAVFEWRGKNYVVSHSSFQLRIHSEEGITDCGSRRDAFGYRARAVVVFGCESSHARALLSLSIPAH
jgi:hypothetical protein